MKKFSQRELIDESVWDTVKMGGRVANAAMRGVKSLAGDALDIVAPELTNPYRRGKETVKRIGRDFKDSVTRGFKGPMGLIAKKLEEIDYKLDTTQKAKKISGGDILVYAYRTVNFDANGNPIYEKKPTPLVVNPETGYISKNLRNAYNLHSSTQGVSSAPKGKK
jgi:hypothetical protein